jgi:hypothetical protein
MGERNKKEKEIMYDELVNCLSGMNLKSKEVGTQSLILFHKTLRHLTALPRQRL